MKENNPQFRRPILIATFGLVMACTAAVFGNDVPVAKTPEFVIVCFPGPPASDNRVEHYERIRQAHFNLVLPSYRYDDDQQLQMLDHCQATGLLGVVNVKHLAPPVAEGPPPADWKELVRDALDRFGDHPALYGYMIRDEPSAVVFPQLARVAREFRQLDRHHDVCVNLFPVYASARQLGVPNYELYLERYLTTVQPPSLCYDHYPFMRHTDDRNDFFENLEIARRACLKHNTPLWIVILANWWEHFRTPSDAELRWQAYGALTYGVRGIAYFTYWPAKEDYAAVVDFKGQPQPLYQSIRRLNHEVKVVGERLASMKSVDVYHTGRDIPLGCRRLPENSWVNVSQHAPLAVGLFESATGKKCVLVTNRNTTASENVRLRFQESVIGASILDTETASRRDVPLTHRSRRVTLPAGTGVLFFLHEEPE